MKRSIYHSHCLLRTYIVFWECHIHEQIVYPDNIVQIKIKIYTGFFGEPKRNYLDQAIRMALPENVTLELRLENLIEGVQVIRYEGKAFQGQENNVHKSQEMGKVMNLTGKHLTWLGNRV